MSAVELIRLLEDRDVYLSLEGERLRLNAPKGVLTRELEAQVATCRREIIALLQERPARSEGPRIPRVPRDGPIQASAGQAGLWFLNRVDPGDTSYNIIHTIRESGTLDLQTQERALAAMMARHEALRTTFREIDGRPYQIIAPELPPPFCVRDLRALAPHEREAAAIRVVAEEARRPFDLVRGPLLRYQVLRLAEDEWHSVLTVHHIVFDGWSLRLFQREMAALSSAFADGKPSPLGELPIQYADFAAWQRDQHAGPTHQSQVSYWRGQLAGPLPVLQWPCARPRPAVRTSRGAVEYSMVPNDLSQSVEALGRRHRATPFMIYLAAFAALLHRYSLQEDLLIGAPIAGRQHPNTEGIVGFFVNTLVLRTDASGEPTFAELLSRVRRSALEAFSNQDVPFEELVRALQPERRASHTTLFQVMFNLINLESEARPWNLSNGTATHDLTLTLVPTRSGMQCVWEYSLDLFEAEIIRGMGDHFQALLAAIVIEPDQRLRQLPLATETERHHVLVECNRTVAPGPEAATIPSLFAAQVARTPDAVAVISAEGELRYRELDARSNGLARRLRAAGVGPGVHVGVCLERSPEVWISLLAVLKAGAAYVPLDPHHPPERLAFMLAHSQARVLITERRLVSSFPTAQSTVLEIGAEMEALARERVANGEGADPAASMEPDVDIDPEGVAYVIYTSGSTGRPKGVAGTHRGAVNRFAWMWRAYPFAVGEICCQKTSLSFVDSIWELFGPLLQGVPSVVVTDEAIIDPPRLVSVLSEQRVSRIILTPSLLRVLLEGDPDLSARLPLLRLWVTSGEAISVDLARRFRTAIPQAILLNLYGSSEVSADVTFYELTGEERSRIPIGRPIANTQVHVLDPSRQPVPVGVPGEIYVGGHGLARGYLGLPELTAERFVLDPFSPEGSLLYRTGDLGLRRTDGNLDFLGRLDDQVKVRGMRIDPGEIEAVLREQTDVAEAVVAAQTVGEGQTRLVAYIVASGGDTPAASDLREGLRRRLPEHMIPAAFIPLPSLPRTPTGKLDRRALPDAGADTAADPSRVAPRTDTEALLASIWSALLGLESIGVHDGFFALGGYSLLAVRLFAEIEKAFGKRLPVTTIFEAGTIEHLARVIDGVRVPSTWQSLVPLQSRGTRHPFFCIHPVDGDIFWYLALASHVGDDQPFYGLRARGLDGLQQPHAFLEEAAADYLREIKQVQPRGPYSLGGYSSGATIAFEMAQQLTAGGDEVGLVALFDSTPTRTDYYRVRWDLQFGRRWLRALPRRLASFLGYERGRRSAILLRKMHALSRVFGLADDDAKEPLPDRADRLARRLGEFLLGDPSLFFVHHQRVIAALYEGCLEYTPRAYAGRVTLFRAEHQPLGCSLDPLMGWGNLALGGVDVQPVPGDHETILQEPHVRALARALNASAQADDRPSSGSSLREGQRRL